MSGMNEAPHCTAETQRLTRFLVRLFIGRHWVLFAETETSIYLDPYQVRAEWIGGAFNVYGIERTVKIACNFRRQNVDAPWLCSTMELLVQIDADTMVKCSWTIIAGIPICDSESLIEFPLSA